MKILWFNAHTVKIKQNGIISYVGDNLEKQTDILSVTYQVFERELYKMLICHLILIRDLLDQNTYLQSYASSLSKLIFEKKFWAVLLYGPKQLVLSFL